MKKLLLNFSGIALAIFFSANLFAQTAGTLTFSFTPVAQSPCYTGTKNVLAVWIQNTTGTGTGTFVKTKFRYVGGGTADHLPTWAVNSGGTAGNATSTSCNTTDATTGATLSSFTAKSFTWDGKNVSGTVNGTTVADGTYKVTIQETWNHGTTGTYSVSFSFTKGPTAVHLTPTDTYFSAIKLDWVPTTTSALTVATTAVNVKCFGGNTGSATATPTGTPAYTYTWSTTPAQNTATATGLAAGTYTVTVKDANGTATSVATITQPTAALACNVTNTGSGCGSSTGTATASPTGGTGSYTYLWSNGKATANITGLAVGAYTVTVTDANGCKSTGVANITSANAPVATTSVTNTSCGASTGTAHANATGGTGSYTYLWSNGKTTSAITGLAAAVYTVTVTDAGGCSTSVTANVADAGAPTGSVAATNPNCFGGADGTAIATASGGTGTLTYSWNTTPVQHTATATGLPAGSYVVTVSDAVNCVLNLPTTISQPTAVSGNVTATAASSCSTSDGSVTSTISGGTAPYTYHWSNNQVTSAINGLAAGTYSLTATDSKGCTFTTSGIVTCSASGTADAGVNSVINPNGSMCSSSFAPSVTMGNFGATTLTSCTINYYVDAPPALTHTWNGSLASGASTAINLPAITGISVGAHTFYSSTSNPNGTPDANTANDQHTSTFNVTGTSSSIPIVEGFETSSNLPNGWTLYNPDNDAAWQVVTNVSHTGTNCIGFDNCDGNGAGNSMAGTKDRFITSSYDFTSATNSAYMTFDLAYAVLNDKNKVFADTLAILASTDCGATWKQFYVKGGYNLSGLTTTTSCWSPSSSDWRTEHVNLGSFAAKSSVMFAFENRSGFGEWVYLDNININALTSVESINPLAGFSIYPNPASSYFTIEGSVNTGMIHYSIYNLVGEEIKGGDIAANGSSFNGKVQITDLSKGMYFVKLFDGKNTWTKKLSVQ